MILGDATTRVLLAVMSQRRPTVRSVAAEVGRSINVTHRQLLVLRAAGLVQWETGRAATLRAMVAPARTRVRYNAGRLNETAPSSVHSAYPGPRRPQGGRLR